MTAAFEARYRAEPDPWGTLSAPYELAKRADTLDACGPGPFVAACELGAGLGALAAELAPRCERLLALDAAPTAVAAAAARLAAHPGAQACVARLPEDLPGGPFDLVVASEVLYYLDDAALARVLAWLPGALTADGRLVAVHWTGSAPDLRRDAGAVSAALAATPGLRVRRADRRAGYRLDVLERCP
jgi:hypothetical protein